MLKAFIKNIEIFFIGQRSFVPKSKADPS